MFHQHLRVLLADDDLDDRLFFQDALAELEIETEVITVNDGQELMDYLYDVGQELPDLIFLDLNMPRKNGLECLKEIRQQEDLRHLCIAVYSTSSSDRDIENTFIQGANIYVKKPNDYQELKKVLTTVLTLNWQYHNSGLNRETFLLSI